MCLGVNVVSPQFSRRFFFIQVTNTASQLMLLVACEDPVSWTVKPTVISNCCCCVCKTCVSDEAITKVKLLGRNENVYRVIFRKTEVLLFENVIDVCWDYYNSNWTNFTATLLFSFRRSCQWLGWEVCFIFEASFNFVSVWKKCAVDLWTYNLFHLVFLFFVWSLHLKVLMKKTYFYL